MSTPIQHPVRCTWPGIADPIYAAYHDTEWGVPHADERRLFEKLILEGFQGGLSWLTVLKKRNAFQAAFDGFDPERMAHFGDREIERLMANVGIIRNRAKIVGAIASARAYLALREETTLAALIWGTIGGRPLAEAPSQPRPTQSPHSQQLSRLLKSHGFCFVGPTTVYAFMQSVGMVNDHAPSCHRYAPCLELQLGFRYEPELSPAAGLHP